jgi:hypothetical protein
MRIGAGLVDLEGEETMSVLDTLRKGFGFLVMSFGVSSPAKKIKPTPKPAPKTGESKE